MSLMPCPGCKAEVDSEQDFCMECGEPIAGMKPAATAAKPAEDPPIDFRRTTLPETPAARRAGVKKRQEEPEPQRCPGCGTKTLASRCPGCGSPIRHPDAE